MFIIIKYLCMFVDRTVQCSHMDSALVKRLFVIVKRCGEILYRTKSDETSEQALTLFDFKFLLPQFVTLGVLVVIL